MSARVEAQAYRVDSLPEHASGIYSIPESTADREFLIDRILAERGETTAGEDPATRPAAAL